MAGNVKLYLKILNDFYHNYKDLNFDSLDLEEIIRTAHTVKGLSANIGAQALSEIAKQIEDTQSKELYPKFYEELHKVCDELKDLKLDTTQNNKLLAITQEIKDELFESLKQFSSKRRAKQCNEIIQKLSTYKLDNEDEKLINQVKNLLSQRKYTDIVELI